MTPCSRYQPMLAGTAPAPFSDKGWLFEIKWDGIRAIAAVEGEVSLKSRNDTDLTGQFPELAELAVLAPGTVLDGEIVVMSGGKPDMQALLPRLHGQGPGPGAAPVTYIVFDIICRRGEDLTRLPLVKRRRILRQSVREGQHVVISEPVTGLGEDYYHAAVAQGLEGVIAKRADSPYEPGVRSGAWLKVKATKTCDCVVAGYTAGRGGRGPAFGALLLGLYDGETLVPVGKVGTGFSDRLLDDLMARFASRVSQEPIFPGVRGKVVWLEPVLVCEVGYLAVTRDRKLRMPRFIRLRDDKPAGSCTLDQLAGPPSSAQPAPARPGASTRKQPIPVPGIKHELRTYHEKRNFAVTPEPAGASDMSRMRFVIQEHHSHKLHYDLRLERAGVLKSWAVPKGIPVAAGEKHLAVAVEDHPIEYATFEGEIPKGEYGAGTVAIWDSGTYETKHWDAEKIEVVLHGKRLDGLYVLVKFRRAGDKNWLLFRTA